MILARARAAEGPRWEDYRLVRFFGALDGFRFLAITAVIWHHSGPRWDWLPGTSRGFLGVDMFFVVSGFLIVTLLLRERERRGDISLRRFYMRRTLRIFPVYYAVLVVMAIVLATLMPRSAKAHEFFAELPFYLTYTSNWVGVTVLPLTWSLATEEQFYVLWPPVEKYLRRWALPLLALIIGLSQWSNFGRHSGLFATLFGPEYAQLEILQVTLTPICFGVLLAHTLHSAGGFARLGRLIGGRWASVTLLLLLLGVANAPSPDISGWQRLSIHVIMTLLVGSCVVRERQALTPLLTWAPVRRIGVVSYGMYLYHVFTMHAAAAMLSHFGTGSSMLLFVSTLALAWAVSELSFRLFESRILRIKERFAS